MMTEKENTKKTTATNSSNIGDYRYGNWFKFGEVIDKEREEETKVDYVITKLNSHLQR